MAHEEELDDFDVLDLEGGKKILTDLGLTARATGTSFEELATLAGDVAKTIDDTDPKKLEKTMAAVRLFAKQGAQGNVEIRDLAKFGGRLTASAGLFEGGADENFGQVGTLAQLAIKGGGATNAAEATTAAAAFGRDLTKKSNLANFKKAGIDVFADESNTTLRKPEDIIVDTLKTTGGDLGQISKLFPNVRGKAAVQAAAKEFNAAGGGASGEQAGRDIFKQLGATLSKKQVGESAKTSLSTKEAGAIRFQNELDKMAGEVGERLLPAIKQLTPHILTAAEALGDFAVFAAENPGKVVTAAIAASIAQAAVGVGIRVALEKVILGATGGGAPGGGAGGAGGGRRGKGGKGRAGGGAAGAGLTIATAAVVIEQVGELVIDKVLDDHDKKVNREENQKTRDDNVKREYRRIAKTGGDTASLELLGGERAHLAQRLARAERAKQADIKNMQALKEEIGQMTVMMGRVQSNLTNGIHVHVDNADAMKPDAPPGNDTSRTGPEDLK